MKLSTHRDINGDLVTLEQACQICNLGKTSVRKLVNESGAGLKIGNCFRIKKDKLLVYIEENFGASK